MTFSQQIKTELCKKVKRNKIESLAVLFGILSMSKDYGKNNIVIYSEFEQGIYYSADLVKSFFNSSDIEIEDVSGDKSGLFCALIYENDVIRRIYSRFGKTIAQNIGKGKMLYNREVAAAFLAGVFIACGTVSDPNKEYHLELVVGDSSKCDAVLQIANECGIGLKLQKRRGKPLLYTKGSETMEDFLTLIGAMGCSLEIMNVKVIKEIRSKINRENNCFSGNSTKSANAAAKQLAAINKLMADKRLYSLSQKVIDAANLRMEYPEESLSQLAEMSEGKFTKSSLNRCYSKIILISEET